MPMLIKPEPFSSDVDRLFSSLFRAGGSDPAQRWIPATDLVEAEDHYLLKADLPGMSEEDIAIEVHDNVLTLSGERHDERTGEERGWFRAERSFGRFTRTLTLPEGIDAEDVSASFDKGVLEVRIPKPERRKPHRVAIGSSGPQTLEGTTSEAAETNGSSKATV